MNNVMGIINVKAHDDQLGELTDFRCIASVPFAGRYRLIDFLLSSMANSAIKNVAVFTSYKCRSLMDHLETGKPWDLNRKKDGLRIFPPNAFYAQSSAMSDIKGYYGQMDYFVRSRQKEVVICPGNLVCNIDFREALSFRREKRADFTVFYREEAGFEQANPRRRSLIVDKDNRILELKENLGPLESDKDLVEIIIVSKSLLMEIIADSIMNGAEDLLLDVIFREQKKYKIYAYPIKGYFALIDSIERYYQVQMDLLEPGIRQSLFFNPGPICTKAKDEPPTKYTNSSVIKNSLLANGCLVEGRVENSILFRGVKVKKGALIKNSIIMQKGEIKEGAKVEHAILDKEVNISQEKEVVGRGERPIIIGKRKKL
jgi:glucose-1-phosphate adenylyltransferase